jgi:zinc protease
VRSWVASVWVASVWVVVVALCALAVAPAGKTSGGGANGPVQGSSLVLPIVKRDSLLNGLQLIVFEQKGTGSVTARLRINSGAMFDLVGKGGLADITAGMLLKGGGGLTSKTLSEIVEQSGLRVSLKADWDSTDFVISGPADAIETIFDLYARLIIMPAFDAKELEAFKLERISALKGESADDGQAVRRRAVASVYGSHPFGRPVRGTTESISQITRPDLLYYHNKFYVANNSVLIIAGDIAADQITKLGRTRLGPWKKGEKVPPSFRPPDSQASRRVMIIDRPGSQVAHATIAQPWVSRRANDYLAAMLAAELLGQLGAKLAESTPGATVEVQTQPLMLAGPMFVNVKAPPSDIAKLLDGVLAGMARLQSAEPALDQIEGAKSKIINRLAERLRSTDGGAEIILDIELYGLGRDYLVTFVDRVGAVTPGDVQRAARNYLKPQSVAVVVAGPASTLEGQLKPIGSVMPLD